MDISVGWAAGFFDGEGCIQFKRTSKVRTRTLYVIVGNYDEGAIRALKERWSLTAQKALLFLREIQPLLVTQKNIERVRVAIEFQEQKPAPGRSVSDERLAEEETLFARLADARLL